MSMQCRSWLLLPFLPLLVLLVLASLLLLPLPLILLLLLQCFSWPRLWSRCLIHLRQLADRCSLSQGRGSCSALQSGCREYPWRYSTFSISLQTVSFLAD